MKPVPTAIPATIHDSASNNAPAIVSVALSIAAVLLGQVAAMAGERPSGGRAERILKSDGGTAGANGPDVIAGAINGIAKYGSTTVAGELVMSYAVGSTACNIGDTAIDWRSSPDNRHPYISQNMYRVKDGRIQQIGLGWGRHGFAALQQILCSTCAPHTDHTALGIGCASPYTASFNGETQSLGARSEVNAATGVFPGIYNVGMPPSTTVIGRRIQVKSSDLNPALNAEAIYIAEAQYIHPADAASANDDNNASWRTFTVGSLSGGAYNLAMSGTTNQQQPAITAWRAVDPAVTLVSADVPSDGRFILGYRVSPNTNGTWRYEYAVQNLNSDRSARLFEVPLPLDATVTNIGFSDIAYHSGDPYDSIDWSTSTSNGFVRWTGPDFAANPNGNALRYSTLYNFWFDADVPPRAGSVSVGLFKPGAAGAPMAIALAAQIPARKGDLDGDGAVGAGDLAVLLGNWGSAGIGDLDGDGAVGPSDLALLLGAWG